jgi:lipid-A-disaccharide synthase
MRDAVTRFRSSGDDPAAIVGAVDGVDESVYRSIVGEEFKILRNMTYDIMAHAELNLVASGTATLECAIMGKSLFVLYKTSALTYLIAKNLVKIPDIGLVNVVAGRRIVPEFVQSNCDPDKITAEISRFFSDWTFRGEMAEDLKEVRSKLGDTGASRKAAESILRALSDTGN